MKPKSKTGELDPDSLVGFATITEYTVLKVLGDATKEKYGAPYDLISSSLGTINVKYSIIHVDRNKRYWFFSKPRSSKIPDYYICLGFDEFQTEIIRVWLIPGNSKEIAKDGISISENKDERLKRYFVNPKIYNKTFQKMDIKKLPDFCNTTKPKVSESRYERKQWELEANIFNFMDWNEKLIQN